MRDNNGLLSYDVTAHAARVTETGAVCQGGTFYCYVQLWGQATDGTAQFIQSLKVNDSAPVDLHFYAAGKQIPKVVALRAVVTVAGQPNPQPDLIAEWTPVSENIHAGHDLNSALTMALAAVDGMPLVEACFTLFPVGTHSVGSVNDQQAACDTATAGGKSLAEFLKAYLGSLTRHQVTRMLAAAGIATTASVTAAHPELANLDYDVPLLGGCVWVDMRSIQCPTSTGPVVVAPKSAPSRQDPTWEANQAAKAAQDRAKTGAPTPQVPTPAPNVSSPWTNSSPSQIDVDNAEECNDQLSKAIDAGANIDEDSCDTTAIFFTAGSSPEATQHDREAIASNPAWLRLTYSSSAEKLAAGKPRNPSWYGSSGCPAPVTGMQCDEYPYYTTNEGYPDGSPSLKLIPAGDNASQGGSYGNFAKQCFASIPQTDQIGRQFLVIPLPSVIPTTTWVCANR
jgi:hypothetical protein